MVELKRRDRRVPEVAVGCNVVVEQGAGGLRYLNTNITNDVGGQIYVGSNDTESQAGFGATTLTNDGGTVTVGSSAIYTLENGSGISNLSGTFANDGATTLDGGTFVERATVSGNQVTLNASTLDDDTSSGAALGSPGFSMSGEIVLIVRPSSVSG